MYFVFGGRTNFVGGTWCEVLARRMAEASGDSVFASIFTRGLDTGFRIAENIPSDIVKLKASSNYRELPPPCVTKT